MEIIIFAVGYLAGLATACVLFAVFLNQPMGPKF